MANSYPTSPSHPPTDRDAEYQPISLLALAGLLIGAASVVAFIQPLLWTVPLTGFFLSAASLLRINHHTPLLTGRKAAIAGLILSTLFGVCAITFFVGRNWVLTGRAQQFTDAWFEHVRNGRFYEAHQFTIHPQLRMPLDSSLSQVYENDEKTKEEYGKFLTKAPMDVIAAQWKGMQVHHVEHAGQLIGPEQDSFVELYQVDFAPGSQPAQVLVYLVVRRIEDSKTGNEAWQLVRVEPPASEKDLPKLKPKKSYGANN